MPSRQGQLESASCSHSSKDTMTNNVHVTISKWVDAVGSIILLVLTVLEAVHDLAPPKYATAIALVAAALRAIYERKYVTPVLQAFTVPATATVPNTPSDLSPEGEGPVGREG